MVLSKKIGRARNGNQANKAEHKHKNIEFESEYRIVNIGEGAVDKVTESSEGGKEEKDEFVGKGMPDLK